MLDDVKRRRLLVEPSRKHPAEGAVGLLHVDLHERSGELFLFPRRRRLAGAQPHDDVLPADRLTGMENDVLDEAVALVEDADHRHPLRHRRDSGRALAQRRRALPDRRRRALVTLPRLAAGGERERRCDRQQGRAAQLHCYSGIHGW
jgi:hypothetical protein